MDEQAQKKIINDPIHKTISLKPLWIKIIDTPEFQRLRYIKQLGFCHYVYPGANGTRFEHSIGVCYLACRMVKKLKQQLERKNDYRITDVDVLCVSIAGLCHDLGHGPFSHTWETFMEKANPDAKWKHEEQSVKIFNVIWEREDIKEEFKKNGLGEKEKEVIGDLILGDSERKDSIFREKKFLFEIVANKKNGVDVDKWDYFSRDTYYLGLGNTFQLERLLESAQVHADDDGIETIQYRDSERFNIYEMFHNRWFLFRRAYRHRVASIIERMFIDALLKIDANYFKSGNNLSGASLQEFLQLNDSLLNRMKDLDEENEARKIIEKIERRKLYKCVASFVSTDSEVVSAEEIEKEIADKSQINKSVFDIEVTNFNYGKKNLDPVNYVLFYKKNFSNSPNCVDYSKMLPKYFQECKISCICKLEDAAIQNTLKKAFDEWVKTKDKGGGDKK